MSYSNEITLQDVKIYELEQKVKSLQEENEDLKYKCISYYDELQMMKQRYENLLKEKSND